MSITETCRICGGADWSPLFQGPIRVGKPGCYTPDDVVVYLCGGCGAAFLPGAEVDYEGSEYRQLVSGGGEAERYRKILDVEQAGKLELVGVDRLRGKVVADVGCGAGSFLDVAKGVASQTLGVEPTASFHETLRASGHEVTGYTSDALPKWSGKVDVAVCFSVLEHIEDPVPFLCEVRELLGPDGKLLLSTPNRDDWMLELLPEDYGKFFYRHVHRWYFDGASLREVARIAGFDNCEVVCRHRFDLSNALLWLRERKPTGLGRLEVSPVVDAAFGRWLEEQGRGDYLYAWMSV